MKKLIDAIINELHHKDDAEKVELWNHFQDETGNVQIFESDTDTICERFGSLREFLGMCQGTDILNDIYFCLSPVVYTFNSIDDYSSPYDAGELAEWLAGDQTRIHLDQWFSDLPKAQFVGEIGLYNLVVGGIVDSEITLPPQPVFGEGFTTPLEYNRAFTKWWDTVEGELLNSKVVGKEGSMYSIYE